jgi:hypothetical protein
MNFKYYFNLIKNKQNIEYYSEALLSDELREQIEIEKQKDKELDVKTIGKRHFFDFSHRRKDLLFQITTETYMEKTGAAWTMSSFYTKASQWIFFGNMDGYVAVRKLQGTKDPIVYKLVSMGGSKKSIIRGLDLLEKENEAVWGVVTSDLVKMARSRGMITPSAWFVKLIFRLNIIDPKEFGGVTITSDNIGEDGGISINYGGNTFKDSQGSIVKVSSKKYFIGNEKYYLWFNDQLKEKYHINIDDNKFLNIIHDKVNVLEILSIFKDIFINLNIKDIFKKV